MEPVSSQAQAVSQSVLPVVPNAPLPTSSTMAFVYSCQLTETPTAENSPTACASSAPSVTS